MKDSIRWKVFFIISSLIVFFVLLSWTANNFLLKKYYYNTKVHTLSEIFSSINKLDTIDKEKMDLEMEKLENTRNLLIVLLDKDFKTIYDSGLTNRNSRLRLRGLENHEPTPTREIKGNPDSTPSNIQSSQQPMQEPFTNPDMMQPSTNSQIQPQMPLGPRPPNGRGMGPRSMEPRDLENYINQRLPTLSKQNPLIEERADTRLNTVFISMLAITNNHNYLFITSPVASIEESVSIANRFFIFTGLATIIVAAIVIFLLSRRFTSPILELNEIAQRMSKLDFSKKYLIKSNDEIGTLGESINSMSTYLEKSIAELQEANKKLLEDIEKERKIDEMRKEFVSNVSHELKTPISLISGYAEGLKLNVNTDEENKNYYCDVIIDEAQKMNKLVVNLLDLSQIESGYSHLEVSDFKMSVLVNQVIKRNSLNLKSKSVSVECNIDPEVMVSGDYDKIEQVLVNYLNNAANHVNNGGVIKISAQIIENKLRVKVFNSGSFIPEESLEKIWISFFKVDKARTRDYGGTGLGLSVVRAIQEAHNNSYGAQNLDSGVEFWFDIDVRC